MSRTGVALDNNGIVMPTCLLIRFIRVPGIVLAEGDTAPRSTMGDYILLFLLIQCVTCVLYLR